MHLLAHIDKHIIRMADTCVCLFLQLRSLHWGSCTDFSTAEKTHASVGHFAPCHETPSDPLPVPQCTHYHTATSLRINYKQAYIQTLWEHAV